jgi:hypothetical protein
MHQLARISLTTTAGHPLNLQSIDIGPLEYIQDGTLFTVKSTGKEYRVKESIATIQTTIDAQWAALLTAIGA